MTGVWHYLPTAMTITRGDATAEAERLDAAERSRHQIRQTTTEHPDLSLADAYRIQDAWRRLKEERGERIIGHKIGLTSRAMQAAMNITTPDSGFLTDRMVFEPETTLVAADFLDPKVEAEVAFVLGAELEGTDLTVDDVLDATDHVTPAVELLAARTFRTDPRSGRTRTVIDTVADNAADAGIVCGGRRVGARAVDLRWIGGILYRNGTVEETGLAAGVLGHPARGVAWLAKRYTEHGQRLRAGDVVLAGSFTRPVDVRPGDEFRFDFGSLGSFALAFR